MEWNKCPKKCLKVLWKISKCPKDVPKHSKVSEGCSGKYHVFLKVSENVLNVAQIFFKYIKVSERGTYSMAPPDRAKSLFNFVV